MPRIDQNSRQVAMGHAQIADVVASHQLLVGSAASKKLRIEVVPTGTLAARGVTLNKTPLDQNSVMSVCGVTNDSNHSIIPLTYTSHSGVPCLRIEIA